MKKRLITCKKLYDKTPAHLRWILSPVKSIYTLFNVFRPGIWIIKGNEISSGKKLVIVFAGHEANKNLLRMLAFADSYEEIYIGKRWTWHIPEIIKKEADDCSLFITELPNWMRVWSNRKKCLYIPCWISSETDISAGDPSLFKQRNTSLKSDLNKIKKNNLSYEVTNDLSRLQDFYYHMYLPAIQELHGDRSLIPSYDYLKSEFVKRGWSNTLLLIKKEEEDIAGVLLLCRKNRTKLWILGFREAELDYVKDGVIGALFYFSVRYSSEKDFTKIDFGGSRPFLKDGALRYKKKWNTTIFARRKMFFLFNIRSKSDGLKGFLLSNPFIYKDKSELNGAIFVTNDCSFTKDDFARIHKEYFFEGLSKLVIFRLGQTESQMPSTVPDEYSDKIEFCPAEYGF